MKRFFLMFTVSAFLVAAPLAASAGVRGVRAGDKDQGRGESVEANESAEHRQDIFKKHHGEENGKKEVNENERGEYTTPPTPRPVTIAPVSVPPTSTTTTTLTTSPPRF